jgi:hypothetical protein
VSEWISVKQELPPIRKGFNTSDIVIGFKGGGIDLYRRHSERPWGWVFCSDWAWGKPTLTHWMPLPAPPLSEDKPTEGQ